MLEALRAKRQMVVRASLFEGNVVGVDKGIITLEFPETTAIIKSGWKTEFRTILNDTVSMIVGRRCPSN